MKATRLPIVMVVPIAVLLAFAMAATPAPLHFKGKVLNVAEGKLALETSDGNVLTLYVTATSHFIEKGKTIALAQLRENDTIEVDVQQNAKGSFVIIEARLAARTEVDEEAGPPRLRRGGQPATPSNAPRTAAPLSAESPRTGATSDEAIPHELRVPDRPEYTGSERAAMGRSRNADPRMELVDRARDFAGQFVEKLPNYVCQQYTTRYVSTTRPVNWQSQDIVSASVVYEDGHEDYRNIAINGRVQTNKKMDQIGGSTSTGEFGTILINLFHPATQANFKFRKESVTSRVTTAVYDYDVAKPNSHWEIHEDSGAHVSPAYRGSVWIDTQTARVLRIEMETLNMPSDFTIDSVETAVDYDYVNLGTERYLLPVRSESISCQRGSVACTRNVIEWRNYHKYLGESKIIFDPK